MQFTIEVEGRARQVTIERTRAGSSLFHVRVDGVSRVVDAVPTDGGWLSFIMADDGESSHEAAALATAASGEVALHLKEGVVHAVVNGRRRFGARDLEGGVGEQRVTAPMPGKILRVMAQAGEQVRAGQGLVVMEAMKMANELRSPKNGRVKEVAAREGASVEAGRLLVVVE